ncbi:antibiotic biosynthesis monooxygenase [Pseudomonas sp. GD03858]|uniref:putative quinol monooxygenase n=1 Tax=unclassified Pseudomonas TaxID=196821 RepID=UPI002449745A|nr:MULTISPECIES: putative quinol monooxygenase [unclassified Pseudomonas]MDH0645330.1 antibiotic biosynthesis monooxygenase [Pseudomonas sp. GD03867]MDH0660952.1 antibiotic biosynthesis monooxygenase [Pseudomonas sp. GD03858]
MSTLYVTASFLVKAQGLESVLEVLTTLSEATLQEPGCLDYGYYQSLENPLQLTSFEVWQDEEAEALHWQSEHLEAALVQVSGWLQGPAQVTQYRRMC